MNKAYDASFDVEKRNIETGEWQAVKKFLVETPQYSKCWISRIDYDKWSTNHHDKRTEAVKFARTIFSNKELHDGVRVRGTANVGCTFWNTCWLNGHWYDDPKEPIASDFDGGCGLG